MQGIPQQHLVVYDRRTHKGGKGEPYTTAYTPVQIQKAIAKCRARGRKNVRSITA